MQNCKSNINYSRENFNRKKITNAVVGMLYENNLKKKCFLPT